MKPAYHVLAIYFSRKSNSVRPLWQILIHFRQRLAGDFKNIYSRQSLHFKFYTMRFLFFLPMSVFLFSVCKKDKAIIWHPGGRCC